MSQIQKLTPEELLDQATCRLRDRPVADLPPGLLSATAEAIPRGVTLTARVPGRQPRVARRAVLVAAAAIAIVAVVTIVFPGAAQVAFAQVLENVKIAESMSFTLVEGSTRQHKCIAAGTKYRLEHSSGVVIVGDRDSKKRLLIDADSKVAGLFDMSERDAEELGAGIVEQLRQVRPDDATPVGKATIAGKSVDVFRVDAIKLFGVDSSQRNKGAMKIFVQPESMLPLRIELLVGETAIVTLRDMKWNTAVEPSTLQLQIPDGYSEQASVEFFEKQLRPKDESFRALTPTEAFRKWYGNK